MLEKYLQIARVITNTYFIEMTFFIISGI